METRRPDPSRHSYRTCSARRSRREGLCTIQLTPNPSGLGPHLSGIGTPRQSPNPLASPEPLLVAQHGPGCLICAISSTPRRLPEGKLVPLPIPHRPWSHLGVDFATDLPPSNGFTTILIVVDRFSKSCKLIPLRGLPSALETAESLFQHIFRNFSLPEDIVSDRGPQFISRVWRGFLRLLGVSVSLSSGYHPQTNGQTERKIQEIGRYLRAYCHECQDSWSQYLHWAEYAQNSWQNAPGNHRTHSIPVCPGIPTAFVSLDRGAIGSPSGRSLVP